MSADHLHVRFRHGMFCHEDGTTIFIGQNGSLISPDLLGYFYDLLLVKSDQRTVDRQLTYFIGSDQGIHGLGCHLSDALTGDQTQALGLLRDLLCDPHHIAAHDDGQFLMRTFLINI